MLDQFRLDGKTAFITGAGRGIGEAIALTLSAAGATLAVAARSQDELDHLVEQVTAAGGHASAHRLDITRTEEIRTVVDEVLAVHGEIDILVNNAGTNVQQHVVDVTEDAFDLVLNTNLRGTFFCAQAVAPHMLERGSGKIVNMASTFAALGYSGRAAYAASKGAVLQATRVMAIEWAGQGLNVNAVGPTATLTKMNEHLLSGGSYRDGVLSRIPAGRWATPQDTANAVLFLAAPASDMVNGHLLLVDGGWSAI